MGKPVLTFAIGVTTFLATLLLLVQPLHAIGPTVLMFYGEPLKKTVFVTGPDAAPFGDFLTPARLTPQDTAGRAFIKVALFWGPLSNPATNGTPLDKLAPEMASQHGRYFPATVTLPAILISTSFVKQFAGVPVPDGAGGFSSGGKVSPEALAILQRLGIPTGPKR